MKVGLSITLHSTKERFDFICSSNLDWNMLPDLGFIKPALNKLCSAGYRLQKDTRQRSVQDFAEGSVLHNPTQHEGSGETLPCRSTLNPLPNPIFAEALSHIWTHFAEFDNSGKFRAQIAERKPADHPVFYATPAYSTCALRALQRGL